MATPTGLDGTRLRRDAADNQRRLLEAAVAQFNEQGMDACVEQIAQRAGVGIGTFYRRFGTKEALVDRLVDDLLTELTGSAQRLIAAGDGAGLELFLREVATALAHHRGILARLWCGHQEHSSRLRPLVAELLATAQRQGAVRTDLTGNDVSVLMWSLRGILELTDASALACQRHLDIALAGMRPGAEPLSHPAMSDRARLKAEQRRR